MKSLLFIILLCFACNSLKAQSTGLPKIKHNSWIYLKDSGEPLRGVIKETNDSTIQFIEQEFIKKNKVLTPYESKTIPILSIEKIRIRSKGSVTKSILIGAFSGAALGAAVGYIVGDDKCDPNAWFDCMYTTTAEEKAIGGAFVGALTGSGTALLLNNKRKTISIKGSQVLYMDKREELKSYSLLSK